MTDEPLMRALGEAEREAQEVPERWRRLATGEASPQEVAALEAEAARDPEVARLLARFSPFSAAEDEALVAALVTTTRPRRPARLRWAVGGVALAAAAAALLTVALPRGAGLPAYQLEASTPDLERRGDAPTAGLPRHHPDSALSLILRPEARVEGPVAVQAFLLMDGAAQPLDARWEVKDGAARLDGRVGDLLPGRSGPLTLLAVVRPADAPPVSADALMAALEAEQPPEGTRWVRYDFLVARD